MIWMSGPGPASGPLILTSGHLVESMELTAAADEHPEAKVQ